MKLDKMNAVFVTAACAVLMGCASVPSNAPDVPRARSAISERDLPPLGAPAGDPSNYFGDARLYTILGRMPLDTAALAALARYEYEVGGVFMDHIAELAEDSSASPAARINALEIIAQQKSRRHLASVSEALHAHDPRVRAVALNTAFEMFQAGFADAEVLLRDALDDSAAEIQAKALQFVGDDDIELLRRVSRSARSPDVHAVVNGLIQAAEERGAALVATDTAAGILERTTSSGHRLRFVPTTQWKDWGAAVGRVTITTNHGKAIELPAEIEVVNSVVPVFFSADGRHVVYEHARTIRVQDLSTGADRMVAAGIAPRIRPITDQFVYLYEDTAGRGNMAGRTRIKYDVYTAPFTVNAGESAPSPKLLGSIGASVLMGAHGNYSPARWMRVEDRTGNFYLTGDELELFALPSPFETGT